MSPAEENKQSKEKKTPEKMWQVVPFVLEKISLAVDGLAERLLAMVSESADGVINRGVQRLFGLLCLGAGMIFFLTGGSEILDHMIGIPGIGAMIVGVVMLLLTALFILAKRAGA